MNKAKAEIWSYTKGWFKVYLEDRGLANQIASWKDCQQVGRFYDKRGRLFGWDLIFPSRIYNRIASLIGLPERQKNLNRVRQGIKIAETFQNQRFLRDTKLKSASLAEEQQKVDQ